MTAYPRLCPQCQTPLEPYAEVDIGVGVLQGGPWGCPRCHWVEPLEDLGLIDGPEVDWEKALDQF